MPHYHFLAVNQDTQYKQIPNIEYNISDTNNKYQTLAVRQLPVLRMHHEEHVGEARPKVGPISVVVSSQFEITHLISQNSKDSIGAIYIHLLSLKIHLEDLGV